MSYYNWFHTYFKDKHKNSSNEEVLNDVFHLLDCRGREYLTHNHEIYKKLYIDPNEDILSSKPQIIQQVKEELWEFLGILISKNVKKVLQIGLGHFGSTQFCLSLLCDKIVTVEYDIKNICNYTTRELLYNQNKEFFVYGDSTNKDIIELVKNHGMFDCVFIDGNHSYEYVKKDYENYCPLIKPGGIVAFHDVFLEGERYGTPKVIKELMYNMNYIKHSREVGIAYFIKD